MSKLDQQKMYVDFPKQSEESVLNEPLTQEELEEAENYARELEQSFKRERDREVRSGIFTPTPTIPENK